MNVQTTISRREFVKDCALAGGGLILACHVGGLGGEACASGNGPFTPNAYLAVAPDETVTVIVGKAEMGQGVFTSLPMLVAEELCCDWKNVRVKSAPVAPAFFHATFGPIMVTGGSSSVRSEWNRLSLAGAAAREMLVAAAAGEWKVEAAKCRAENGIVHGPGGRKASFGTLAAKAAKQPVPENPKLHGGEKNLLGKPVHRLDSAEKIAGRAVFGIDVYEPDMLTVLIARPPVFGAKLRSFDATKALAVPGVREVKAVPAGVAVAALGFWPAKKARNLLVVDWDLGPLAGLATPALREQYRALTLTPGAVAVSRGDAEAALGKAAKRFTAIYEVPYLAHAPMEPLNCFVDLRADSCHIRTGSQMQSVDRNAAAREAGLKPEQVTLENAYLGGGFGRRACKDSDFVLDAVGAAKAFGKPVKVLRTREDDLRSGYYRPMWVDRIEACLDDAGYPLALRARIAGQSIMEGSFFAEHMVKNGVDETSVEGAADTPYAVPNLQVELHSPATGVPVLWWRSVGHSHTAFLMECFLDELAHAAGIDPLAYRRKLLAGSPRHLGVLNLAAKEGGWGSLLPKGFGRGLAVHASFGSYVASVAEVVVGDKNRIRVAKITCAVDCGRIVNPDTVKAQMESAVAFGLSAALHGAITFADGRVEQSNFHDYPLVSLDEMPRVNVHIVDSKENPGGIGEPGVPPVAPAVANAVFAATGIRARRLPMTPQALAEAKQG